MRSKTILFAIALALAWAPAAAGNAATPCYIGTYADPMHVDVNTFAGGSVFAVDVWVWVKPSDVGLKAVEFMLGYPTGAFPGETYTNPDIPIWLGDLNSGISAAFGPCQTDWVWTHRQVYYVFSTETKGYFSVLPHPAVGVRQYASCEDGHPLYPLTVANNLALNQCAYICGCWPRIATVEPRNYAKLRVDFGSCVGAYGEPFTGHFHLFADGSVVEAIDVVGSERISEGVFDLALGAPMTAGMTYVLVAREMPNCEEGCPWIESSSRKFFFDGQIATELKRSALSLVGGGAEIVWEMWKVEPGTTFLVSRSRDGEAFEPLGPPLEEELLSFRYFDRAIEPGRGYVYRVECMLGESCRVLFTTDRIVGPAVALELHQNAPNPFNPGTTISFTLPEPLPVTLEIYDVAGRLVARLFDREPLAGGAHVIDWNGRDASGRGVGSGIYLYRLRAGKTIVSRKMVLLR